MPHAAFATNILVDYFTQRRDSRRVRSMFACQGEPVPFVPPPVRRSGLRLRRRVRLAA